MNTQVEATDYANPELRGVIDFMHLPTGGTSVQPVTDREFDMTKKEGKVAYEKFMTEPVVILIHSTNSHNEPTVADVKLNGVPLPMPRDVPIRVPRAFVEVIAQSQIRTYQQERVPDPDATEGMKTKRKTGTEFPFRVLEDKNPKGRAWLQRVVHQSA